MSIPQQRALGNPSGLRIFLVGTGGYASIILRSLLSNGEAVVGICCHPDGSGPRLRSRARRFVRSKLVHLGLYHKPDFAFRDPFSNIDSPGSLASKRGIPVLDPRGLRTEGFEAALADLEPDVAIMCGFRRLVPPNIIRIPKTAFVNIHTSLLPKHRGGTPTRWVIRYGERETGVTAHLVNERFDRGDIIVQERLAVEETETWGELDVRMAEPAVRVTHTVLEMVAKGRLVGSPETEELASYEPPYKGEHQLIRWELGADEIRRICYAIRPGSGGITCIGDRRVCVWELEVLDGFQASQSPGTVMEINKNSQPLVACGTGAVRILEFLYSGTIVPAKKVVKWCDIRPGSVFDTLPACSEPLQETVHSD